MEHENRREKKPIPEEMSRSKGEIDPLSSVLVTRLRYDSDGAGLPLPSDLTMHGEGMHNDYTLLVGSEMMGRGNEALGRELMWKFFRALLHQAQVPLHIVFLNSGACLTKPDSPIHRQLHALKEMGCALHVDQTSLTTYEIMQDDCLATPINSIGLAQLMVESQKVITLP